MRKLALSLAAAAALAPAAPALARDHFFRTPSGRIYCVANASFVRCDASFLNDVAYVVGRHGKGHRRHVTDSVYSPSAKVLRYGRSLRVGVFRCSSRRLGLTCRNPHTRHGFFLSRQRRRVF